MKWTFSRHNQWFRPVWISGNYKIIYYKDFADNYILKAKRLFHAYWKISSDKAWGMNVDSNNPQFKTLQEAQNACEKHYKEHQ